MSTALLTPPPTDATPVRDEPLYEVVDGVRVELPEMSIRSNEVKSDLHALLWAHVRSQRSGRVVTESLIVLDAERDLQRRPDVAFVSNARWPIDRETPWEGEWEVIPNLCIEVISPSDLYEDVMDKVDEYLQYGVEEVWVVRPPVAQVQVFGAEGLTTLSRTDVLTTEVIPGFSLPLATLFASASPART